MELQSAKVTQEWCMLKGCIHPDTREHSITTTISSTVDEWQEVFEAKVSMYAEGKLWLSDTEVKKWGRDEEEEVEKFIKVAGLHACCARHCYNNINNNFFFIYY